MKNRNSVLLLLMIVILPQIAYTVEQASDNPVHKYWVCAINRYSTLEDGKYQAHTCRANTQYSEPPCPEFYVDYEGENGVRPGISFEKTIGLGNTSPPDSEKNTQTQSTTIEIRTVQGENLYRHSIVKTVGKLTNKRVYEGKCEFYQAPSTEKIYMNYGLKTAP